VTQDSGPHEGATRRAAIAGVGLAGLAAALSACGGPAPSPLPTKSITVAGGKITLA
jgi:hypothetical protein